MLTDRFGYLRLYTRKEVMNEICLPSFIGRRQRHKVFLVKTAMEFTPSNENEEAGIALVQDERFHYLMILTLKNRKPFLQAYKTENGIKSLLAETEIKDVKRLYLSVQGNTINYDFYYGYTDQEMIPLIRGLKASLLSSVVNNVNHPVMWSIGA